MVVELTPTEAERMRHKKDKVSYNQMTPAEAEKIYEEHSARINERYFKPKTNRTLLGELGRSAASGAAAIGDAPYLIGNLPIYGLQALGAKRPSGKALEPIPYPSELVRAGLERLGGVEGEPTKSQKIFSTPASYIGTGMGAKLAHMGLKKGLEKFPSFLSPKEGGAKTKLIESMAPSSWKDIATLGGAGLLGGALRETVSEKHPIGRFAAEAIGAGLGGAGTRLGTDIGTIAKGVPEKVAKLVEFDAPAYEAYQKAGITPSLAEVSKSGPIKTVQNLFNRLAFSSGVMRKASERRKEELSDLGDQLIDSSKILEPSEAGKVQREGFKSYNKKAKEIAGQLYERGFGAIPKDTQVPLMPVAKAIDKMYETLSPDARNIITASKGGKALIDFRNSIRSGGHPTAEYMPLDQAGKLPFGDLKNIYKSDLADIVDSWQSVGTRDQGKVKKILDILDKTTTSFLEKEHPEGLRYLKKADKFWADYSELNRHIANQASETIDPFVVWTSQFNRLKRGNTHPVEVMLKESSPAQRKEIGTTWLNEFGLDAQKDFSLEQAAQSINKLKPKSKDVLFGAIGGEEANKLRSIFDALKFGKSINLHENPSGTAYMLAMWETIRNFTAAAPGLGVSYVGAKKFTDPAFLQMLYEVSRAPTTSAAEKTFKYYNNMLNNAAHQVTKGAPEKKDEGVESMSPEEAQELLKRYGLQEE